MRLTAPTQPAHFQWIREQTLPDQAVATREPSLWLYTARKTSSLESSITSSISFLQKALQIEPWFQRPKLLLAEAYIAAAQPQRAEDILLEFLAVQPAHPSALTLLRKARLSRPTRG